MTGIPSGDATWNQANIDWNRPYTLYYQVKWYTFQNDEHNIKIEATSMNQTWLTLFNMEYRDPNVYNQQVRAVVDFGMGEIYYSIWDTCKLITATPTSSPSISPTTTTTISPSKSPTISPSNKPSNSPTNIPTVTPTVMPTTSPISPPTISPTSFPSNSPSKQPTITPTLPTPTPIWVPTITPTISPTQPPNTILPPIDWCIVVIKDEHTYEITFEIPSDTRKITHYIISYLGEFINAIPVEEVSGEGNFTDLLFTKDVNITPDTPFYMSTINRDFSQWYTNNTQCKVLTISPTISPTLNPGGQPTALESVGVFVYSEETMNSIICEHDERCACESDRFNFECIGSDHINGTQIEDSLLRFEPSDGEQKPVLRIGRYSYYFKFDVSIEWEFVYLNDTTDFNYGKRVKPIKGSTTIEEGEKLGDIVFAEFIPMPNEKEIENEQWYMFKILDCKILYNNEEIHWYMLGRINWYMLWTINQTPTPALVCVCFKL